MSIKNSGVLLFFKNRSQASQLAPAQALWLGIQEPVFRPEVSTDCEAESTEADFSSGAHVQAENVLLAKRLQDETCIRPRVKLADFGLTRTDGPWTAAEAAAAGVAEM